jgi:hypothetical protein
VISNRVIDFAADKRKVLAESTSRFARRTAFASTPLRDRPRTQAVTGDAC